MRVEISERIAQWEANDLHGLLELIHPGDFDPVLRDVLACRVADTFALWLDVSGWKIVPQDPSRDRRWFMIFPVERCPDWADPGLPKAKILRLVPPPKPD